MASASCRAARDIRRGADRVSLLLAASGLGVAVAVAAAYAFTGEPALLAVALVSAATTPLDYMIVREHVRGVLEAAAEGLERGLAGRRVSVGRARWGAGWGLVACRLDDGVDVHVYASTRGVEVAAVRSPVYTPARTRRLWRPRLGGLPALSRCRVVEREGVLSFASIDPSTGLPALVRGRGRYAGSTCTPSAEEVASLVSRVLAALAPSH